MLNPVLLTGIALTVIGVGRQEVTIGVGILLIILSVLKIV